MGSSPIDTLRRRLRWLEWACTPGPKVALSGRAQAYQGPTPAARAELASLRLQVRVAELDLMIMGTEQVCGPLGQATGPAAEQLRRWYAERDGLAR